MNHQTNQTNQQGAQAAPQPSNPLPAAMKGLEYTINGLAEVADVLADRLERVLMPRSPSHAADTALTQVKPVASAMVDDIDQERQRIERIVAGLQDVLNRLEV